MTPRTPTLLFIPLPRPDQDVPFQRAMWLAGTPPAVVNIPPATSSPLGRIVRAPTSKSVPLPRPDQVVPFQRATLLAANPPATLAKRPPTTRPPLGRRARARTLSLFPYIPLPKSDQETPFQRAIRSTITRPARVMYPHATRSPLGMTYRAVTRLFNPLPRDDHVVPFQRAMWLAVTLPAVVKSPPTTRSPLGRTATAPTVPKTPGTP